MKTVFRTFQNHVLAPILEPISRERRRLIDEAGSRLPEDLKLAGQTCGVSNNACGATHGIIEQCNLTCTSCYLTEIANLTKPLPFDKVREQLDTLRKYLGPAGKAQITSGEVTLLAPEQLGRIVLYARKIGLDPMVMTNGVRLLNHPHYLRMLVKKYGLQKIGVHVDSTQLGRKEVSATTRESDLNDLRNRFANLIRDTRRITRKRIQAAHTVTITPQNVDDIPDVFRWTVKNADAFRMISLQPVAQVGRTKDKASDKMGIDYIWSKISKGAGRPLNREAMYFGHPGCNIVAPLIIINVGHQIILEEAVRKGNRQDQEIFERTIHHLGGFSTAGLGKIQILLRVVSLFIRNPFLAVKLLIHGLRRSWNIRHELVAALPGFFKSPRFSVNPLVVVIHQFMDSEQLKTRVGRERLASCVFKVPVEGQMVSMCEVNATGIRRNLNLKNLKPNRLVRAS